MLGTVSNAQTLGLILFKIPDTDYAVHAESLILIRISAILSVLSTHVPYWDESLVSISGQVGSAKAV